MLSGVSLININGIKAIIELFGTYWHSQERTGIDERTHMQSRKNSFKKFEYCTLIVWQSELSNIPKLEMKIHNFYNNTKNRSNNNAHQS